MATRVNPTRMELSRQKKRLKTAVKGHKLLKDKRDEMVRQFMLCIRRNRELRKEVEEALSADMRRVAVAAARMGSEDIGEALLSEAGGSVSLEVGSRNIMGVSVPTFTGEGGGEISELPYSFAFTSAELDGAVLDLAGLSPSSSSWHQVEKTCAMLADEIEKTRPPGQRPGARHDPGNEEEHPLYLHEAGGQRAQQHHRLMKVKEMLNAEEKSASAGA